MQRRVAGLVAVLFGAMVVVAGPGLYPVFGATDDALAATASSVAVDRGAWRELPLHAGSTRDVDMRLRLASDRPAAGADQVVAFVARRTSAGEYRVRVRLTTTNRVQLSIVRRAGGRTERLGPVVDGGFVRNADTSVGVRVSVSGTAPTMIRAKVWLGTRREPSRWSINVAERDATMAVAGTSLVRFAVAKGATNAPVTYVWDRLTVSAPASGDGGSAPDPTPTPSASPTPAPTNAPAEPATQRPVNAPTATPAPTQAPTTQPTATPSPTATPTPSPSVVPVVPAAAVYVSTAGNDAADGSRDRPWRTIQRAADATQPGTTVVVRGGTYAGFVARRSGTADRPVTFMSFPGETAIVDGANSVAYTVQLSGVAHVRIFGLTVQRGFAERHQGGGIQVVNSSSVVLRDNTFRDNRAFGIRLYNSTRVLVERNDIHGNAVGVQVNGAGDGTVVRDNDIHENDQMMVNTADVRGDDVGGEGVAIVRSTGAVEISRNRIWGNRSPSYDYGYDGGAFSIYAASNWTIRDNVTWDNRNVLETGTDAERTPCDGNTFVRNLNYAATTVDATVGMVLRCASNTVVANNTFHGMQSFVFDISHMRGSWGGSTEGLRVINNVISISTGKVYGIETALPASVVIDNNVVDQDGPGFLGTYLGTGTRSLESWRSMTGQEAHGTLADPGFFDPAARDFRLRPGSVAVDRGWTLAGITDGFAGRAPDCGFLESN